MKVVWIFFLACLVCLVSTAADVSAVRPFTLPVAAKAVENSKDGKGWLESGVISVPFVQAEGSFKAALAQSGWKYLHSIALSRSNAHTIYTWRRGGQELTLMLRRIEVNRTAFSWGLAKVGNN